MRTYISILRGINVGGQKSIKMDSLSKLYEGLHFRKVRTYIQSGNVIFRVENSKSKDLGRNISNHIQKEFGYEVPVIVLDAEELQDIVRKNPFATDMVIKPSQLHVTFLSSKPEHTDIEIIQRKKSAGEEFSIIEKAVYLNCPDGYGKTRLTNAFFENTLQVRATTRNWKTTLKLLEIAAQTK